MKVILVETREPVPGPNGYKPGTRRLLAKDLESITLGERGVIYTTKAKPSAMKKAHAFLVPWENVRFVETEPEPKKAPAKKSEAKAEG